MRSSAVAAAVALMLGAACSRPPPPDVSHALGTAAVPDDPDDPAVWVSRDDPARSLLLGTNKVAAPRGALVVFGLNGAIRQTLGGLDRPNNVDVEYGLVLRSGPIDIAVVTERLKRRLRVYRITPDGLEDVSSGGGLPVFEGQPGEQGEPMGIALYRRSRDLAVFAIVSRKSGPREGYLWQYELLDDGAGKVKAAKVRELGSFSGAGEIEAVAVDDAPGYVYYADEGDSIHKWHADPDVPGAGRELARFGAEGFRGNREGIGIYTRADGSGYIVCTDQLPANSRYNIYRREGKPGNPHDHSELLKSFSGGADSTDGIEVTSASLGPQFPNGLMAAMNSRGRNFLLYRWEQVAGAGPVRLEVGAR